MDFSKIKYKDGGRYYPSLDCYGLLLEMFPDEQLPVLSTVSYFSDKDLNCKTMIIAATELFTECSIDEANLAYIYSRRHPDTPTHIVCVSDGHIFSITARGLEVSEIKRFTEKLYHPIKFFKIKKKEARNELWCRDL